MGVQEAPGSADTPTERPGQSPAPPAGLSGPASGGLDIASNPSVPRQDLSGDKLLATALKVSVGPEKTPVPALGGIPLLAKLGQGGMGAVYYGIHPRLEIEVAVKVLPFNIASQNPDLIQRFYREAKIAAKVKSPRLVTVTDVNEEQGLYFIVMEFVSGESAGAYLRKQTKAGKPGLAESTALDIAIAATEGLCAAHEHGVIHRDIKPDNVMVPRSKNGDLLFTQAKLADLGLARTEDTDNSLTGTQASMGTPGYMAPEQGLDAKRAGKPADIFSMGATIYALLSGKAPFAGSSIMRVLMDTAQTPHAPIRSLRPDVSEATGVLLDHCLDKDPSKRFADGASLLEALKLCRKALAEPDVTVKKQAAAQVSMLRAMVRTPTQPDAPDTRLEAPVPAAAFGGVATPAPVTQPQPAQGGGLKWLGWAALLAILLGAGGFAYSRFGRTDGEQGQAPAAPQAPNAPPQAGPSPSLLPSPQPPALPPKNDQDTAEARSKAQEAQAGVEALVKLIERAETELRGNAVNDPILKRVQTLCDRNAFGGEQRLEAEKALNIGKALTSDKKYLDAAEKFAKADELLKKALSYRQDAEAALRGLEASKQKQAEMLKTLSTDEAPLCMTVERALNEVEIKLQAGDAATAKSAERSAAKGLLEIQTLTGLRREMAKAREQVAGLVEVAFLKERFAAGDAKAKEADEAGWSGKWEIAKAAYGEGKAKYEEVSEVAKIEGVKVFLIQAKQQYGEKQYDAALESLGLILKVEPNNSEAKDLKPIVEREKSYESALAEAKKLLDGEKLDKEGRYTNIADEKRKKLDDLFARALVLKPNDAAVKALQEKVGDPKELALDLGNGVKVDLILIPAGKFSMGSPASETDRSDNEGPQHDVKISKSFYMGKCHVTVGQFREFVRASGYQTDAEKEGKGFTFNSEGKWAELAGANWKKPGFEQGEDHPVCLVSWNDSKAYCAWMSQKTGRTVRLPTEAEWEYAARAGTQTVFIWGNDPEDGKAWANAADQTAKKRFPEWPGYFGWDDGYIFTSPGGKFKPNKFGLYDMTGNAWSWCEDWYGQDYFAGSPGVDPTGPAAGEYHVLRGGGWGGGPRYCRVVYRFNARPAGRYSYFGFRVVAVGSSRTAEPSAPLPAQPKSAPPQPDKNTGPAPLWDGKESVAEYAKRAGFPATKEINLNGVKLELVLIPAGKFIMGSPESEAERGAKEKQHEVTITNPYYIGKYEVTQAQWEAVMGKNPSGYKAKDKPVETVSWNDIQEFMKQAGNGLRLPTEAQWEYACRAGTKTAFYTGDRVEDLARAGWYGSNSTPVGNSGKESNAVGQKAANAFGIYDMHGNVLEWCADWYGAYPEEAANDPKGPAEGTNRVVRGGSWVEGPKSCRAACRGQFPPTWRVTNFGFRVVVILERTP